MPVVTRSMQKDVFGTGQTYVTNSADEVLVGGDQAQNGHILKLPMEIYEMIFSKLSNRDLRVCRQINKKWAQAAELVVNKKFKVHCNPLQISLQKGHKLPKKLLNYLKFLESSDSSSSVGAIVWPNIFFKEVQMFGKFAQNFFTKFGHTLTSLTIEISEKIIENLLNTDCFRKILSQCIELEDLQLIIKSYNGYSRTFLQENFLTNEEREDGSLIFSPKLRKIIIKIDHSNYWKVQSPFLSDLFFVCKQLAWVENGAPLKGTNSIATTWINSLIQSQRLGKISTLKLIGDINPEIMALLNINGKQTGLKLKTLDIKLYFWKINQGQNWVGENVQHLLEFFKTQAQSLTSLCVPNLFFILAKFLPQPDDYKLLIFPNVKNLNIGLQTPYPCNIRVQFPSLRKLTLIFTDLDRMEGSQFGFVNDDIPHPTVSYLKLPHMIRKAGFLKSMETLFPNVTHLTCTAFDDLANNFKGRNLNRKIFTLWPHIESLFIQEVKLCSNGFIESVLSGYSLEQYQEVLKDPSKAVDIVPHNPSVVENYKELKSLSIELGNDFLLTKSNPFTKMKDYLKHVKINIKNNKDLGNGTIKQLLESLGPDWYIEEMTKGFYEFLRK